MISLKPTIPDIDDPSSDENVKAATMAQNRAEIFKKNKVDPETVTF